MLRISAKGSGISKSFNRRKIFSDISFVVRRGDSLAIAGRNGSGKSTLMKIIAGVLSPTRGTVQFEVEGKTVKSDDVHAYIGFVSPYLQLYDEFTGWENLDIFRKIRGIKVNDGFMSELLTRVNIFDRRNDFVRTYSSGMKQRLKFAFALLHQPPILLLDEPTSNLDSEGIATIYQIADEQKNNGILLVATNDAEDIKRCERVIDLNAKVPMEVAT
jgi:heme exporter protein A